MKEVIVMFDKQQWYSLDINNHDDYVENCKLSDYSFSDVIISFQTSDLIRELISLNIKLLPNIIDLESFDKQMTQLGGDERNFENWNIVKMLKHHNEGIADFQFEEDKVKNILTIVSALYKKLCESKPEERQRFENIEQNINRLIYERQFAGICFSKEEAIRKSYELEKLIYTAKNELQLEHGIFMPENEQFQKDWLREKEYKIINSLLNTFKIHRNSDKVCNLIYEMIRNKQDLDSILFMMSQWGGRDKTYPSYFGFGTITSRITMRQPSLQNMRKTNRSIIKADSGMKLLYVDYSQFEAGILASLSDDKSLIKLYDIDIYNDLAKIVFNDESEAGRKNAKIVFYRYMYGDKTLNKKARNYFDKFRSLKKYVNQVEIEAKKEGKIGTSFGNYRYSINEESTWILSHKIQATASLIFKKALIRVHKEVDGVDFLIPMHDAALYQIQDHIYEVSKIKIETIFKEEFQKICPQITPRVNVGNFYEEKS